jgi:hypothetical protein
MADAKLELLRQKLREDAERKNGNRSNSTGDKASYPFWNIPEKQTATVRFLPDRDDNNPWFWVERQTIRLPFSGIVGGERETTEPQHVTVPCIDMFVPNSCPITAAIRPLWKSDEKLARMYWKKRTYIAQGFVVSSPFDEPEPPENPIRRFNLGSSLLEKLKAGLIDPEMESIPTDYINGTDFKIKKTRKSDFNNYDTSEWSRRTRPLSESEHIAIERFGLFNLRDFIGNQPDAESIEVIKAMFHASINGEPFDMAQWGAYYKPYGAGALATVTTPEGVDDFTSTPVNSGAGFRSKPVEMAELKESNEAKPATDDGMDDILARITSRVTSVNH